MRYLGRTEEKDGITDSLIGMDSKDTGAYRDMTRQLGTFCFRSRRTLCPNNLT